MTGNRSAETTTIHLDGPADLLAVVPYLLGFHPDDSLVSIVVRGRQIVFCARADLPAADAGAAELREEADYLGGVLVEQRGEAVLLAIFGPPERGDPLGRALCAELARREVPVLEVVRAWSGRYWSLLCDRPECCPPDGKPFDPGTSQVAAAATLAGCVALPDRTSLVRQVAPIGGLTRVSMRKATDRATALLYEVIRNANGEHHARQLLIESTDKLMATALDRYRDGERLTDDEAAWFSLLLSAQPLRDLVWSGIGADESTLDIHRALWGDLVRRVQPDLVPAPGCLLAFTAWRQGDGALASIVLDRVLGIDPDYLLAHLLAGALQRGVPPSILDDFPWEPVTPEPDPRRRTRSSPRRVRSQPA